MSDFYNSTQRVARKEHTCGCYAAGVGANGKRCYRSHKIRKGQRYVRVAQVFDGDFSVSKLCLIHEAMILALFRTGDDYSDGVDYQYARDDWEGFLKDGGRDQWFKCLNLIRTEMKKLREKR